MFLNSLLHVSVEDQSVEIDSAASRPKSTPGEPYPEVDIYLRLLVARSHCLLALKNTYGKTMHLVCDIVGKSQALSCWSLDPVASKVWLRWIEGTILLASSSTPDHMSIRHIFVFHVVLTCLEVIFSLLDGLPLFVMTTKLRHSSPSAFCAATCTPG